MARKCRFQVPNIAKIRCYLAVIVEIRSRQTARPSQPPVSGSTRHVRCPGDPCHAFSIIGAPGPRDGVYVRRTVG